MLTALIVLLQEATIYGTVDADAAPAYQAFEAPKIPGIILEFLDGKPAKADDVRAALAPFDATLAKLAEAARAKRCAWSYPGRDRHSGVVPIDAAIAGARLFSARARLRLESGEVGGAVDDVVAAWGVGIHYLSDGPVVPTLCGLIALMMTEGALQVRLPGRTLTPGQLRRLADHAEAAAAAPSYRRMMEGEKRLALGSVDEAIEDMLALLARLERAGGKATPKELDERGEAMWTRFQDLLRADPKMSSKILRRRVEELWEDALQDAGPKLDLEALKARSVKRWVQYEGDGDPQQGLEAAADIYGLLVTPRFEKAKLNLDKTRLALGLRVLWCRAELAERERGAYPESLEGLKPPVDPWDGQPLMYRRFEKGGRRGFILTASGPKKDGEARMSRLAELDFDLDKFEDGLGDDLKTAPHILWQLR